jgi:hypothetical protein
MKAHEHSTQDRRANARDDYIKRIRQIQDKFDSTQDWFRSRAYLYKRISQIITLLVISSGYAIITIQFFFKDEYWVDILTVGLCAVIVFSEMWNLTGYTGEITYYQKIYHDMERLKLEFPNEAEAYRHLDDEDLRQLLIRAEIILEDIHPTLFVPAAAASRPRSVPPAPSSLSRTEGLEAFVTQVQKSRAVLPTAPADASPVDAAVFCPPRVSKSSVFLVQVCLYSPGSEDKAVAHAREADPEAERRGTYSLPLDVPPNTRVDLHLQMPDLEVEEPNAVLIWRGTLTTAQFEVAVPDKVSSAEVIGRVRFAVAGVPAGTLRFKVGLNRSSAPTEPITAQRVEAERYRRAFVSYSSKDRNEVLKRVQAFRIAGLSMFQDILDLEPGERWARELYREIDNCDVFLLFWSHAAAASEWVAKEIAYALERKAGADDKPPAIQPVPIEGPPPPPPEALRHLHFNDALLAHIQAAEASAQSTAREGT